MLNVIGKCENGDVIVTLAAPLVGAVTAMLNAARLLLREATDGPAASGALAKRSAPAASVEAVLPKAIPQTPGRGGLTWYAGQKKTRGRRSEAAGRRSEGKRPKGKERQTKSCAICKAEYHPRTCEKICGKPECRKEYTRRYARAWYARKHGGRRSALEGPGTNTLPPTSKAARLELIRRRAERINNPDLVEGAAQRARDLKAEEGG